MSESVSVVLHVFDCVFPQSIIVMEGWMEGWLVPSADKWYPEESMHGAAGKKI